MRRPHQYQSRALLFVNEIRLFVSAITMEARPSFQSRFRTAVLLCRLHWTEVRGPSGRRSVGSFPREARASHRTACRSLSNLRTSIAPRLDCSDQAPPVPDLPPSLRRASPLSWLKLPAPRRAP